MASKYPDKDGNQHTHRLLDIDRESCEMLTPILGYEKKPLVSLEEAIEPIVSLVPDVKRMAFVAKMKCKKAPANNLSNDESASIILYSMEWEPQEQSFYYVLNQTLRSENRKKLKPWFLYLKLVLTALSHLPSSNRFVFRGIKRDMRKDYPEGGTVYWWGFSSCTSNSGVLKNEDYLGSSGMRTMFGIECFSGKDIRQHSHFQDEAEILLPPGRQFEVVSCLNHGNDLYFIQLKEIEPTYPLLEPVSHISTHILDTHISDSNSTVSSTKQANIKETTANSTTPKMSCQKICPPHREINVLLLGRTGIGKSTFINALANYICNDTLEQAVNDNMQVLIPFSFSFTDMNTSDQRIINLGEENEHEKFAETGKLRTEQCRSFVFPIGDRILRLIETPAVGDTRGFEQDIQNLDDIITYIAQYEHLNGIYIFLKPNEARLNVIFRYCFKELLRHLPKSAIENIIFVFTKARSIHFMPGSTASLMKTLLSQYKQEYGVQIHFTKANCSLLDNESFQYLALRRNGIQLDNEQTLCYQKSWDHTVKEYARLITYVTTRPVHAIRDTVLLYEVEQLIRLLTTEYINLSSRRQFDKHANNLQDEETKIEDVYKKLCKFLLANAILPFNDDIIEYLNYLIREEEMGRNIEAQTGYLINHLQTVRSKYENEINLFRTILENERNSKNKIELIQAEDVFPLVGTLYKLRTNGQRIREQVEQLKINQKKTEKREIFVKLPTKAGSSKLMLQLKEIISNS